MPFAVFRRHQKKLMAVFAILAMFVFVVADSLPRLLSGSQGATNPEVVKLYGRSVRRGEINRMMAERNDANMFFGELGMIIQRQQIPPFFGPITTDACVDALILEHEADRLGMPVSAAVGRDWLKKQRFAPILTTELFELILRRFNGRISGEQLLSAIANQVRISSVRQLLGAPVVTPLDVFETYKDQNEKVSARAVGFRTDDYLKQAGEPTTADVRAYYDKYKDVLPDPDSPTPGFKVPRQVKLEILSIDGEALSRSIKDRLTDAELLAYYETRKNEFKMPNPFPDDIFQGMDPLPPMLRPFPDVKIYLANSLAEEKTKAEIAAKFATVSEESMSPFAEKYAEVLDENAEAKRSGSKAAPLPFPKPESLEAVAKKAGLDHVVTPLLSREQAERYGQVSTASVGLDRFSDGRRFIDEFFDPKPPLYEPIEMADASGRRFLIRKLEDQPPRVPSLKEIEVDVVLAWKSEHARPFAEKAARDYAETVKKAGGKVVGEIVEGRPVVTTDPVPKLQASTLPGRNEPFGPAQPSEIFQVPNAGPAFRDTYFALKEGEVAVVPNEPKTTYYVLTLNRRIPATFDLLYSLNGEYERYRGEAINASMQKLNDEWMGELRAQAGLPKDWVYRDESKSGSDGRAG